MLEKNDPSLFKLANYSPPSQRIVETNEAFPFLEQDLF